MTEILDPREGAPLAEERSDLSAGERVALVVLLVVCTVVLVVNGLPLVHAALG